MPKQGGKPYSLSLPDRQYKWSRIVTLPHFILWGRITNDEIAHLAITECGRYNNYDVVWECRVVPYCGALGVEGNTQAKHVLEKFERLWPCQFLAKEYLYGVETV